jgi:DNA-binding NarL/FixJ family response regulator
MDPIRIVVADDHAVFRTALRALLQAEGGMAVVGEAATGEAAVEAALSLRPDVVLMDLSMPGCGGLAATRTITASTGTRVLVLSVCPEHECLLPALAAGASGYLTKTAAANELVPLIRRVARGEVCLSSPGVRTLVKGVTAARDGTGRGRVRASASGTARAHAGG